MGAPAYTAVEFYDGPDGKVWFKFIGRPTGDSRDPQLVVDTHAQQRHKEQYPFFWNEYLKEKAAAHAVVAEMTEAAKEEKPIDGNDQGGDSGVLLSEQSSGT